MSGVLKLDALPWQERQGVVREALFAVLRGTLKSLDTKTVNSLVAARLGVPADKVLARVIGKLGETYAQRTGEVFNLYGRPAQRWTWPPMQLDPQDPSAGEADMWTVPAAPLVENTSLPVMKQEATDNLLRIARICEAEGITLFEYLKKYGVA